MPIDESQEKPFSIPTSLFSEKQATPRLCKRCCWVIAWFILILFGGASGMQYTHRSRRWAMDELVQMEDPRGPLVSRAMDESDWYQIQKPLMEYLERYDHKIICELTDEPPAACLSTIATLARQYFESALKQTEEGLESRIWRKAPTGELYGALIIMDPDKKDLPQVFSSSKREKDACAQIILGINGDEVLRYIRLHVDQSKSLPEKTREDMLNQFLEESMVQYLCAEYKAGGPHTVAIFPTSAATKYFTRFGFEIVSCGENLRNTCQSEWFTNRCLVTKTLNSQSCPLYYFT
ncbi:unnamed protein product [Calicophoron daubneyi]|uniref:N-acetyltransferase domain-containing protein n=1 Tax=Calicophoron daubneyi TaxID=300641 RepID=A0AAV2TC17_CALDB